MRLVVIGLSLSSSWGNGHATTYRALLRAFAARDHEVTFFEWDAPWYSGHHRDLASPDFLDLVLYPSWPAVRSRVIAECRSADAVVVGSYVRDGIEVLDDLIAAAVAPLFFYDIDTPVTVAALRDGRCDYLAPHQVPAFDAYLSFTGGPFLERVVVGELGARAARPLYCSVDLERYRPSLPDPELHADLAYMGTYAPDRQPVVERLLLEVARRLPEHRFIVAGPQYPAIDWPANVRHFEHLGPDRHAAFYSSARWQLNATRGEMVAAGWSPSVRLFEAGAAGAPIISDRWEGIDHLFADDSEIVLADTTDDVVRRLRDTPDAERRAIGERLRARIVAEHSSERRAAELEGYLSGAGVTA
jgi:spore maturation protein CgeB